MRSQQLVPLLRGQVLQVPLGLVQHTGHLNRLGRGVSVSRSNVVPRTAITAAFAATTSNASSDPAFTAAFAATCSTTFNASIDPALAPASSEPTLAAAAHTTT